IRRPGRASFERRITGLSRQLLDADLPLKILVRKWQRRKLFSLLSREWNEVVVKARNLHASLVIDDRRQQLADRVNRIGHRAAECSAMQVLPRTAGLHLKPHATPQTIGDRRLS